MRMTRQEMLVDIVQTVAKRSTCDRKQVGALIEKEGRVLSIGYAGSPPGLPHCQDEGCLIGDHGGCIRTSHAEVNAISWAARNGIAVEGANLWCTLSPCLNCAKLIIQAGIKRVYCIEIYRDRSGIELLGDAGVEVLFVP